VGVDVDGLAETEALAQRRRNLESGHSCFFLILLENHVKEVALSF
jgi:hypothetical protein